MAEASEPGAEKAREAPVDLEAIRHLLDLMNEHGLVELEIERDDMSVRLRKAGAAPPSPAVPAAPTAVPAAGHPAAPSGAGEAEAAAEEEALPRITSPMVGTFYTASGPEAEPFVRVGDHVDEDTIVCVIEAMKVFNEIRAETCGTIEQILVGNAEAVEFGQPLFVVRPD